MNNIKFRTKNHVLANSHAWTVSMLRSDALLEARQPSKAQVRAALARLATLASSNSPKGEILRRLLLDALQVEFGTRIAHLMADERLDLITVTTWLLTGGDTRPLEAIVRQPRPPELLGLGKN